MGAHFLLLEELDGLRRAIEAACLQIHLGGGLSSVDLRAPGADFRPKNEGHRRRANQFVYCGV